MFIAPAKGAPPLGGSNRSDRRVKGRDRTMSKNDARITKADAVIVRLDENMNPTVEELTVEVPYTRVPAKAAASIRELLHLGSMDSVMVKEPLHQTEYERRVYDAAEVFATAARNNRAYTVYEDGTDSANAADVEGCKRIVVDVFDYSMVCLLQTFGGDYRAAKVRADYVTECRSGLGQIQYYLKDVLDGTRTGNVRLYNTDGTTTDYIPGELAYERVAAWDADSKYRSCHKMACYLTPEQLEIIPFTVYKRGDDSADDNR